MIYIINLELEQIIEDIKVIYIGELRKHKYFPYICHISSAILYDYFERLGYKPKMVTGNIYNFGRRKKANFHTWLEIEDKVIDFLMFQFYITKKEYENIDYLNDYDLMEIIKEKQEKFIFSKEEYYELFYKKEKIIHRNPYRLRKINLNDSYENIIKVYCSYNIPYIRSVVTNLG